MRIQPAFCVFFIALFYSIAAQSQDIRLDVGESEHHPRWLMLPFLFHSESLDTAYGISGGTTGYY